MKNSERILALKEGYFASTEERQKYLAESWRCSIIENNFALIAVEGATYASYYGPGTYSKLSAQIEDLLENEECAQIGIEFNSPGGDVNGLFECCAFIAKAKAVKPIHAHVTGICCSAAFALAASCTDISATETSEIGSVGVYAHAFDDTEYLKKQGILSRIFRSKNAENKNKSAFTEEGAKDLQEKIDYFEDCFYSVLSEGRGMDKEQCLDAFGHGAVFLASDAKERNMIDSIAGYGEWINGLTSSDEEEDEGEDDMDIKNLTAEQRAELFNALVADNPSLLANAEGTARKGERDRLTALAALRNGTDAVDAIINAAVEDGRSAQDVALDIVKAMKNAPAPAPADAPTSAAEGALRVMADSDQQTSVPSQASDDMAAFEAMINRVNKDAKEGK